MGSTLTTFDSLLKIRYIDSDMVEKLTYPDNVLLGMLEKRGDTGMVGSKLDVPLITVLPQGVSSTFASAQAAKTNIVAKNWLITAGDYYGSVDIGDKVMMASRTNQGAFLENKVTEIDGLYMQAGEALSIYTWGNGGQNLGRIASIATNDITLVNSIDAQNFEIGMSVVASANDGSTATDSLRDSGDSTTITAVNRATGAMTLASAAAISGLAVGDYLFRLGDFYGDQGAIPIVGLQAFLTATDSPGALWNITAAVRAADPQRYAGCRVAASSVSGKSYEERIKALFAQMTGRFKAKAPTAGFMNPEDFQVLETLMSARGVRPLEDDSTKFGYMKIDVMTGSGRVPIYCDRHCPIGTFFGLQMENWWISSMGELLHPQTGDGLQMLRKTTSTDYEFRLISYPLLACNAPKNNGRVPLAA